MNLSKYIGETFPAGKTAKELNLDKSHKFVVVHDGYANNFKAGTVLTLARDYDSVAPFFTDGEVKRRVCLWRLAYLEEEDEEEPNRVQRFSEALRAVWKQVYTSLFQPHGISEVDARNQFDEQTGGMLKAYEQALGMFTVVDSYHIADGVKNMRIHDKPLTVDEHKKAWLDGKSTTSEGRTVGVDDTLDIDEICVGDEVALKGKVESIDTDKNTVAVRFPIGFAGYASIEFHDPESIKNLTLISRKPRTLTKEEATKLLSEKLGEEVTIE